MPVVVYRWGNQGPKLECFAAYAALAVDRTDDGSISGGGCDLNVVGCIIGGEGKVGVQGPYGLSPKLDPLNNSSFVMVCRVTMRDDVPTCCSHSSYALSDLGLVGLCSRGRE